MAGKVSQTILERYLRMEKNIFLRLFFQIGGFRKRLLADPGFLFKLVVECGIGICTKSAAEYTKRQESFWKELDFVTANVIMAILADFMLVWIPAPTLVYDRSISTRRMIFPWFKKCPDNAFQVKNVVDVLPHKIFLSRWFRKERSRLRCFNVSVLFYETAQSSSALVWFAVSSALQARTFRFTVVLYWIPNSNPKIRLKTLWRWPLDMALIWRRRRTFVINFWRV